SEDPRSGERTALRSSLPGDYRCPGSKATTVFDDFVNQVGPSTIGGLASGAIYALIALGYTMVYGVLRLINFAHSEIFMIGAFAGLFAIIQLGITAPLGGLALIGTLLVLFLAAMA